MHDTQGTAHESQPSSLTDDEVTDGDSAYDTPTASNLLSVLTSATPPVPRNARIIRRIGLGPHERRESPRSAAVPAKAETESAPAEGRRTARARRNTSLRAAAGLE